MKKRLIILFISIFIIYIFNISYFNSLYYLILGNYYYNNGDFNNSIKYHKNIISNNKYFLLGGDYYKLGEYDKSLLFYNKIIVKDFDEKYKLYNNIGNIYYKLGLNINNKKKKLTFLYKSKEKYQLSLDLKDNYKAKNNYFFILQEIKKLEQKEKQNKNDKENNINNTSDFNNELTIQDEENIDNYIKKLKKEEKYNRQFLNIKTMDNNSDLLNSYFYEKFHLVPSNSNNLEKDW